MLRFLRSGYLRRWVRFNATNKGLFGGSKLWLTVFGLGVLGRGANKVLKRGPMPVVLSEKLEPGQSMVITHIPYEKRSRRTRS